MGQILAGYRRVTQDVNETLCQTKDIVDNAKETMCMVNAITERGSQVMDIVINTAKIIRAAILFVLAVYVSAFCYNHIPAICNAGRQIEFLYNGYVFFAFVTLAVIASFADVQRYAVNVIAVLIGAYMLVFIGSHLKNIEVLFCHYVFECCKALLVASGGLAAAYFLVVYVIGAPNMEVIQRNRELAARRPEIERVRVRQQQQSDRETLPDEQKKCPKMRRRYSSQQNNRDSQQRHSLPPQQKPKQRTLPRSASDMEMGRRAWRY